MAVRSDAGGAVAQMAAAYHAKGLVTVPLQDNKRPAKTVSWNELTLEDSAQFDYSENKAAGFVIRWPYFIIDVDVKNGGVGEESLKKLSKDLGYDFEANAELVVHTTSGGRHLYYKRPEAARHIKLKKKEKGYRNLDFLSDGAYVVMPDSMCGGRWYRLDTEKRSMSKVKEIPLELVELLRSAPKLNDSNQGVGDGSYLDTPTVIKQFENYLEAVGTVGEGDRNNRLYTIACRGMDFGVSPKRIYEIIEQKDFFNPPLTPREMQTTILSASKTRQNEVGLSSLERAFASLADQKALDFGSPEALRTLSLKDSEQQFTELIPWHDQLKKNRYGVVSSGAFCVRNCEVYLRNLTDFEGRLAFNEWSKETVWIKPPKWHQKHESAYAPNGVPINDDDLLHIKSLFNDREFDPQVNHIYQAARLVSMDKTFHPVKKWFGRLPEWDGTNRLRRFFKDYFNADDIEFHSEVGELLFCAIVKRIMEPGCKFDFMPVLIGQENQGKSTAIARMSVHSEWFTDSMGDIAKTGDTIQQIRGKLLIEDGELTSLTGSRVTAANMKAFISRQVDRARLAYAKLVEDFPRQCVFMATTNESIFLTSVTGNRRVWPIEVRDVDIDGIERDLEQLYAEALVMYEEKYKGLGGELVLRSKVAIKQAKKAQDSRVEIDEWERIILSWLEENSIDEVDLITVWEEALGRDSMHLDMKFQKRLSRALNKVGYFRDSLGKSFKKKG